VNKAGAVTIVNLNKYRKHRQRVEDERRAVENRVRFGRNKEARTNDIRERDRSKKNMEDKRLD
jgi:hypothetical protein